MNIKKEIDTNIESQTETSAHTIKACRIILWFLKLHSIILCQSFAKSAIKTTYLSKRFFFFLQAANLLFSWLKSIWSLSDFPLQHKFACNIEINSLFSKCLWITPLPICHPVSETWHSCVYKHFIHLGFLRDGLRLHFPQILFLLILQFHVCLVFSLLWWMHWNVIAMSEVTGLLTWFKVDFLKIGQMIPF